PGETGRGLEEQTLIAVLPRWRPEQGKAFASLVVEQVGVDGRREGGIVKLEGEVVATFLGALRPGGADLDITAHENAVARSFVVGGVGFRDDADAFSLEAEGGDVAVVVISNLLERTDGSHVTSPVLFRARDHRGLDGDLQAEDDWRRTRRAG